MHSALEMRRIKKDFQSEIENRDAFGLERVPLAVVVVERKQVSLPFEIWNALNKMFHCDCCVTRRVMHESTIKSRFFCIAMPSSSLMTV